MAVQQLVAYEGFAYVSCNYCSTFAPLLLAMGPQSRKSQSLVSMQLLLPMVLMPNGSEHAYGERFAVWYHAPQTHYCATTAAGSCTSAFDIILTSSEPLLAVLQNDSLNMGAQLLRLSKGAVPTRIECTGHSLGGGLATICGVWAAMVWPQSDVRIVTFGSPKAGNSDFAAGVLATVGRTYRVVNMYDEVRPMQRPNCGLHAIVSLVLTAPVWALTCAGRIPLNITHR